MLDTASLQLPNGWSVVNLINEQVVADTFQSHLVNDTVLADITLLNLVDPLAVVN